MPRQRNYAADPATRTGLLCRCCQDRVQQVLGPDRVGMLGTKDPGARLEALLEKFPGTIEVP